MRDGNYNSCDDTKVKETEEAKDLLVFAAFEMIIWRAIIAVIISLIYIINVTPSVEEEEENCKDK